MHVEKTKALISAFIFAYMQIVGFPMRWLMYLLKTKNEM